MRKKVIFDFDQTLISKNSFPCWVLFLIKKNILSMRFWPALSLVGILLKRKVLNVITHDQLKEKLIRFKKPEQWNSDFAKSISKYKRQSVIILLSKHVESGDLVILSSAAPQEYLSLAAREILPKHIFEKILVIGSRIEGGQLKGNYKEEKAKNLYDKKILLPREIVFKTYTDSWDDKHLALISSSVTLVNPDSYSLERFNSDDFLSCKVNVISSEK